MPRFGGIFQGFLFFPPFFSFLVTVWRLELERLVVFKRLEVKFYFLFSFIFKMVLNTFTRC